MSGGGYWTILRAVEYLRGLYSLFILVMVIPGAEDRIVVICISIFILFVFVIAVSLPALYYVSMKYY